ncbi:MAG: hypothetical protein ACI4B6_04035 [Atopobiaceae bacterium]
MSVGKGKGTRPTAVGPTFASPVGELDRRRRRRSRVLVSAGVVLAVAGALMWAHGQAVAGELRQQSAQTCAQVTQQLDQVAPASGGAVSVNPSQLAVLQVEGIDVVGRLQASAIGLDLPVAALGSSFDVVPALEQGRQGQLVVHGCSYQGAMSQLDGLAAGTEVTFTQVDGATSRYQVVSGGVTSQEFDNDYDLLIYWADELGSKRWVGCSLVS